MVFRVENEKSKHHNWILHIRISVGIKFDLKLTILTFWTKFLQKGHFWSKKSKVNSITEFYIFELVYVLSFPLNWQFWQFGPNLPKKGNSGRKRKKVSITIEFYVFELSFVPYFYVLWHF